MTDKFLDPLFTNFFNRLSLPNLMRKTNYHELARFVPSDALDPEVADVLDAIFAVAQSACPRRD